MDARAHDDRHESDDERHDRNWIELLNELRVAQTGVQILAGFLLTLPFSQRFGDLTQRYVVAYLVAFGCAAGATLFIVAPASLHRALYQRHRKGRLVEVSDRLAKIGTAFLGAALVSVSYLIFGVTIGDVAGAAAALLVACGAVGLWWALPMSLRH